MIQIIIIVFIALAILGFLMEHWKEILEFVIISAIAGLIIKIIGVSGLIALAICIGIISLIIKGINDIIKRICIFTPKSMLKEYIEGIKIETYDSILRNARVENDQYSQIAFN